MNEADKKSLYEILGIDATASKEDIKKAYHEKAQETHPDKQGGSQEKFLEVSRAYKILSDEEKRQRYDDTGEEDDSTPREEDPKHLVLQVFLTVISNPHFNPKKHDAFESTKGEIEMRQSQIKNEITKNTKEKTRYEEILSRIESAPEQYKFTISDIVKRHTEMGEILVKNLNLGVKMLEVLKDYKYRIDKDPSHQNVFGLLGGTTIIPGLTTP